MSANELTVPAHQRCRRDEEGGPTLSRKKPSECREHGAIGGGEPRPRHLAAKDRELMTEHRDLDVLLIRAWTDSDEPSSFRTSRKVIGQAMAVILAHLLRRWSEPCSYACTPQAHGL